MSQKPPNFEEALKELEDIVSRLEAGGLPLDETMGLYERGQELAARCNTLLDQAELRVRKLSVSSATGDSPDGAASFSPLDSPEE